METNEKLEKLKEILQQQGRFAVAFSGGVDSTFLLAFAHETLGAENVVALSLRAPVNPPDEMHDAAEFCEKRGIRHIIIDDPDLLETEAFSKNPPDRCYHCKLNIFTKLLEAAQAAAESAAAGSGAEGEAFVLADGSNLDDMSDYRPGAKALTELGILSPLRDAQLTKAEIRGELKRRGLAIYSKPACACLASRIPYGEPVTAEKVHMVYEAETALRRLGFTQVRVRHHGDLGRVEVLPDERRLLYSDEMMDRIAGILKDAGFRYATLELSGYEMGSLNKRVK